MKKKSGQLTDKKIWLAPLAGYTDQAFRLICKKCGADVLVSEMVSADGIIYNLPRTFPYTEFSERERPFGIQIFGNDPEIMQKAASILIRTNPDFLDINMGCPVKKVVKRGAGSALMKDVVLASKIVNKIKKISDLAKIPISVKFRAGWNDSSINAISFGKAMAEAGADFLCLHPRTKRQMFSGSSDWQLIKFLKQEVKIPVIGNGDIFAAQDAEKMFKQTGCDAIMIGRGALGNPWIFTEIKENSEISFEHKTNLIKEHFSLMIEQKGEKKALIEMRSHFHYYTKGLHGGKKLREKINHCKNSQEMINSIEKLYLDNYERN